MSSQPLAAPISILMIITLAWNCHQQVRPSGSIVVVYCIDI